MDTGVLVHMRLDRTVSLLLIKLDQSYSKYADEQGCIVVLLKKALFGCAESAALWHEDLTRTLAAMGYERNTNEKCVYNERDAEGTQ